MSRILRRPMFRGGRVDSRGTGITSGLDKPKRGYVNETGSYAGEGEEEISDYIKTMKKVREYQAPKPGLTLGDYLRIASAGAEIIGAPSEGGDIGGVLATASKPLARLGSDLANTIDRRSALGQQEASDITQAIIRARAVKSGGTTYALDRKLEQLQSSLEELGQIEDKLAETTDETERNKLLRRKGYLESAVEVISPKSDPVVESFMKSGRAGQFWNGIIAEVEIESKLTQDNPKFPWNQVIQKAKTLAKKDVGITPVQKAEGGIIDQVSVDETIAGPGDEETMIDETQETTEEVVQPLSYEELRQRLPKEISDDIVLLISKSTQAYLDFANIGTQKDVADFNVKYGVELVLPQV
jgi:hypothetical protein